MHNIIARLLITVSVFAVSPYLPAHSHSHAHATATPVAADVLMK